ASKEGAVAIEYLYSEPIPDGFEAVFQLTNFGSEDVRFNNNVNSEFYFCRLHEGRLPGTIRVGSVGCLPGSETLSPSESEIILVPVEPDDSAYFLLVRYFDGANGTEQQAKLFVNSPHKPRN